MRGQIVEWNRGKGYQRGLIPEHKEQPAALRKQGKLLAYLLDEDLNIILNDGKKVITIVSANETRLIGFQD